MDTLEKIIETTNRYGLPLPLIIIVFILYRFLISRLNWWNEREKYYYLIINNLGIWKDSLSDRLDYYQQPGSEYRDEHINKPHYIALQKKGNDAFQSIRQDFNVAKIFLSEESIQAISNLFSKHWLIVEHEALSTQDYLESSNEIAESTYELILKNAKNDLRRNRSSIVFQKMFGT